METWTGKRPKSLQICTPCEWCGKMLRRLDKVMSISGRHVEIKIRKRFFHTPEIDGPAFHIFCNVDCLYQLFKKIDGGEVKEKNNEGESMVMSYDLIRVYWYKNLTIGKHLRLKLRIDYDITKSDDAIVSRICIYSKSLDSYVPINTYPHINDFMHKNFYEKILGHIKPGGKNEIQ